MCKWGEWTTINVIRLPNHEIEDGWYPMAVDSCIAEHVQKMNDLGIITINSCCGHFKEDATVLVANESIDLMKQHGYQFENFDDGWCLLHTIKRE